MKNQVQFKRFGTMIDCSRNAVMNVKTLKKWIDLTADLGYNTLCLYMEDTYEGEGEPYFGYLRGRYSKEELKEIDGYAKKRGMELIPCVQSLAKLTEHSDFGFLFKTLKALSEVLAVKGALGIQTRTAYKAGDKKALRALLCRYEEVIEKTEAFYRAFREQWYAENKPHGFNVQDVRIGGVIMRLKNGKALLEEYLDGKIDKIEELEEDLLNCADFEVEPKKAVTFARWDEMTSVCKF